MVGNSSYHLDVSSLSKMIEKENRIQQGFEKAESIFNDYLRYHRDPVAYNKEFQDRYDRLHRAGLIPI